MTKKQKTDPVEAEAGPVVPDKEPLFIVGVGASAGGLEALERLLEHLPAEGSGVAFVIVQHLSPDHKSLMVDLLSKRTCMTVLQAENGTAVAADTIYLLPPGKIITIRQGRLELAAKDQRGGIVLPIDIFLNSLALDQGPLSVAVILSGTGSDGTRGVRAIHEQGGMVVVQTPSSARFDGMPRSAIDTGVVDEILPPEEIVERLMAYAHQVPHVRSNHDQADLPEGDVDELERIIRVLQTQTGMDFSRYRRGTLLRRIERRMHLNQIDTLADYVVMLSASPQEAANLKKELLIGVTAFFRDTDAFAELSRQAIGRIVADAGRNGHIRVWVCGCASGEEAYSVAILFAEALDVAQSNADVKIFATDIDRQALDYAGCGVYAESVVADIAPELRDRYFTRASDAYKISLDVRRMITFASHNVIKDPPFTKLDLICCRNLLIYFEPELQQSVLARFQFALKMNGTLFLGSSETLAAIGKNFETLSAKQKLFRLINPVQLPLADISDVMVGGDRHHPGGIRPKPILAAARRAQAIAVEDSTHTLLRNFCPPSVLVDEQLTIIHNFGGVERYLRMPQGDATHDLARYLPSGVSTLVTATLHRGFREWKEIQLQRVPIDLDDGQELINLHFRPVTSGGGVRHVLLMFIPNQPTPMTADLTLEVDSSARERILSLEAELQSSREDQQAVVEELETTNEELQATNEELLASNEELQSTNEELQSVNEELYTVNSELKEKLNELTQLTDDLDNLMRATEIGTVFLDDQGHVRRFTPAALAAVNLMERDIGRRIFDLSTRLRNPDFFDAIGRVLHGADAIDMESQCEDGRTLLVRILPYAADRAAKSAGVVITFTDVTPLKAAEHRLQGYIDSLPHQVAVLDGQGRIVLINAPWRRAEGGASGCKAGADYLGSCLPPAGSATEAEAVAQGLHRVLNGQDDLYTTEYHCRAEGKARWLQINVSRLEQGQGGAVVSHVDITSRKDAEDRVLEASRQLQEQAVQLKRSNADLEQFAYVASHDLRQPLRMVSNYVSMIERRLGDTLDPDLRDFIGFARDGAKAMNALIVDLLEYSRIGRDGAVAEVFPLRQAVGDAVGLLETAVEETKAHVTIETDMPTITGNRTEIIRLFQNLIGNALKYRADDRAPEIAIRCRRVDGSWEIGVHDNGIGIAHDQSERIFRMFQRLHNGDKYDGTGIGLAVCQKIVECHGGRIWVESVLGRGSTFFFTLPNEGR